jgi:hypothetical protein
MSDLKQANLVILTSVTGRDGWHPLKFEEVPDWVKTPDNIARLRAGFACMDPTQPNDGSNWYRAVKLPTVH